MSVIRPITALKLAVTIITSLYFRALRPNRLDFFGPLKNIPSLVKKLARRHLQGSDNLFVLSDVCWNVAVICAKKWLALLACIAVVFFVQTSWVLWKVMTAVPHKQGCGTRTQISGSSSRHPKLLGLRLYSPARKCCRRKSFDRLSFETGKPTTTKRISLRMKLVPLAWGPQRRTHNPVVLKIHAKTRNSNVLVLIQLHWTVSMS